MGKTRVKMGGRQKGTPNKRTLILEELLNDRDIEPIEGLQKCLVELEGIVAFDSTQKISLIKAKADIYMELLSYLYPKRKAIEFQPNPNDSGGLQIVKIQWADENVDHSTSENEAENSSSNSDQPKP